MADYTTVGEDVDELVERLSVDQPEAVDIVIALQPLMAPAIWREIAEQWEICPMHGQDEQICRDDELDCPAGVS